MNKINDFDNEYFLIKYYFFLLKISHCDIINMHTHEWKIEQNGKKLN